VNEPAVRFFISLKKRLQQQNKEGGRTALLAVCKRASLFIAAVRLGISFDLQHNAVITGDKKLLRLLLRTLKQRMASVTSLNSESYIFCNLPRN
jgi:hypothetical protein